jgi:uncharacterized paraquat-inducible protein A
MTAPRNASLRRRFPRRIDIPVLLLASAGLIAAGLITPAVETEALFWHDEYSILLNLRQLSEDGKHTVAAVIALCSVAYPATKIALLTFYWLFPFHAKWRWRSIQFIRLLGRWGMVDVFAVVTIIVASMSIGPLKATPRLGLFLYAAGMLCLMFTGLLIDHLARCRR